MSYLQLISHEVVNDLILLQWSDGTEHALPLKILRQKCPCATCAGETDVFGNVYIGEGIRKTDLAFELNRIEMVGHYAIRLYWNDNHNSGIYPLELLKKIENES